MFLQKSANRMIAIRTVIHCVHLNWRQMDRQYVNVPLKRRNRIGIPVTSLFCDKSHKLSRWVQWTLPKNIQTLLTYLEPKPICHKQTEKHLRLIRDSIHYFFSSDEFEYHEGEKKTKETFHRSDASIYYISKFSYIRLVFQLLSDISSSGRPKNQNHFFKALLQLLLLGSEPIYHFWFFYFTLVLWI